MAGYLLGGSGEGAAAVIVQILCAGLVGTADFKGTAGEAHDAEIVEPLAHIDGVERPCTVQYLSEDIFNFTAGQVTSLYENNAHNKQRLSITNNIRVIETADNTTLCNFMMTIPEQRLKKCNCRGWICQNKSEESSTKKSFLENNLEFVSRF